MNISRIEKKTDLRYIDLIANTNLNACVTKKDNVYYIGINYGGLYVISDTFFRMLPSPEVLPEYGNYLNGKGQKNTQCLNYRSLPVIFSKTF